MASDDNPIEIGCGCLVLIAAFSFLVFVSAASIRGAFWVWGY